MQSGWKETTFGEVVDFFDHKRVPLNSRQRADRKGIYPYYGASGIIDYVNDYLFDGRYLLIAEDGENLNSRKLPIAFFASGKFWVNNHAHIVRCKEGIADDRFLKHWFAVNDISGYVTGAAQPKLSQANLRIVKIVLPEPVGQQKIAAILSAYDDLIENNLRRIQILEEMARRIYEEWFVRFRFPGHENVKMVESEIGLIPDGWSIVTLEDSCSFISRGISPRYEEASDKFVINQKCIRDEKLNLQLGRPHSSHVPNDKLVRFGDVLINSTGVGTLGRLTQVYSDIRNYTVDSHVTIVRPKSGINQDYFGMSLLKLKSHFERLGFGATGQTELSRGSISNTEILLPISELRESFSELVSPMRENAVVLIKKNDNLRRTRDLLLPKLISGEIDVSNFPEPETL